MEKRSPDITLQQAKRRHANTSPPNEIRDMAQTRATWLAMVYKKLTNGADFAQVAKSRAKIKASTLQRRFSALVYAGTNGAWIEDVMNIKQHRRYQQTFRTQFGWHILQVERSREADISAKSKTQQCWNAP